jgi:hypothetical protein
MLAAEFLSEVRNRRTRPNTDDQLQRIFIRKVIRYDPPFYSEWYEEPWEIEPTRMKAVRLIASVWRSEKVRVHLSEATKCNTD